MPTTRTGVAAGVPYLAVPPLTPRPDAPVVLAWHLMDPPRTEAAFAAALPLSGLDAWRVYLGLPLSGARLPAGGDEEIGRLGFADAVLELHGPIVLGAAAELPAALAALRAELDLGDGPLALVGGSSGSAVAQLVLAEAGLPVRAAVLVSPVAQLRRMVDAIAVEYGFSYPWAPAGLAVADRLDFVARAADTAGTGQPAVLIVVGADDSAAAVGDPAAALRAALTAVYDDPARVALETVPGMGHALADEPGVEPAPQTPQAASVDRLAVTWLQTHLP